MTLAKNSLYYYLLFKQRAVSEKRGLHLNQPDDWAKEAETEELIREFIERISNDEAADLFSEIRTGIHVFGQTGKTETVCSHCFLFKDALAIARYCNPGHPGECNTENYAESAALTFEEYKELLFKAEVMSAQNHAC